MAYLIAVGIWFGFLAVLILVLYFAPRPDEDDE